MEREAKIPISVIIITFNEQDNIKECIDSVYDWADEIFIVDSGSTDKTLSIAKQYTDKVYDHPFENYAVQRNWAQSRLPIRNEWIFHLDADERVSNELIAELKEVVCAEAQVDGFMVARKTIFRGRCIKHGGHYPVYHMRIFKKSKGRCQDRLYDQHYEVKGKTIKLKGDIVNIITPDITVWKSRHRKWAYLEAVEILSNKHRILNVTLKGSPIEKRRWFRYKIYYRMPLFIRAWVYYVYRYVFRLGFLDGKQGLIFHFLQGLWYRFLVDYELCKRIRIH
ncbi:MAG: glycosyltransferase family 2 protein [Candidatus Omnitrophota bacterium]|nr:MAG: glycosyltransferase family 2 protein [Candidatus Omnitrophota bacterium]